MVRSFLFYGNEQRWKKAHEANTPNRERRSFEKQRLDNSPDETERFHFSSRRGKTNVPLWCVLFCFMRTRNSPACHCERSVAISSRKDVLIEKLSYPIYFLEFLWYNYFGWLFARQTWICPIVCYCLKEFLVGRYNKF